MVLDPAAADLMRAESYDTALREMAKAREDVLDLVTAYGEDRLRTLIDGTHERLRTAGHPLRFDPAPPYSLPDAIDNARTAALALARTLGPGIRLEESRARALALAELLEHPPHPSVLAALPDHASRGRLEVAGDYDAALAELERARPATRCSRTCGRCWTSCCRPSRASTPGASGPRRASTSTTCSSRRGAC